MRSLKWIGANLTWVLINHSTITGDNLKSWDIIMNWQQSDLFCVFFFSYAGFSFGGLINGVTKRFASQFEYDQVRMGLDPFDTLCFVFLNLIKGLMFMSWPHQPHCFCTVTEVQGRQCWTTRLSLKFAEAGTGANSGQHELGGLEQGAGVGVVQTGNGLGNIRMCIIIYIWMHRLGECKCWFVFI